MDKKFNPKKIDKLNDPKRLEMIPPNYIWDKLDLRLCKTIIDIGAGTGIFSNAFSKLMSNGYVYAMDISDVMLDWIRNNLSDNKSIIPIKMDESKVPLDNGIADLVIMITLHHELDNPKKILKESYRLLKKGGKVCIIDFKKEETSFGPPMEIRVGLDEITQQLETAGFSNIKNDINLEMFNMVWGEK